MFLKPFMYNRMHRPSPLGNADTQSEFPKKTQTDDPDPDVD